LRIEAYLKADANITTSKLVLFFYDSDHNYLSRANGPDLGGSFVWTYANLSAIAPSGVNYFTPAIEFTSRSGTNGHGFVDDVYLNGWPKITNLGKMLSLLNVKYLLIHDDSDSALVKDHPFWVYAPNDQLKSLLNSDRSMVLAARFGQLVFYRNLEWKSSQVYGTTGYQATAQNDTGLLQAAQLAPNDTGTVIFASQQTIQTIGLTPLSNLNPQTTTSGLTYERLSSTSYTVNVNSQGPFFLVLSESYDPNWSARTNGFDIQQHFVANGYANGWYVDHAGKLTITLEFVAQRLATIGDIVSILTLVSSVTFLSRTRIRNSRPFKALVSRIRHWTLGVNKNAGHALPENLSVGGDQRG
jgi:hypothetical protein